MFQCEDDAETTSLDSIKITLNSGKCKEYGKKWQEGGLKTWFSIGYVHNLAKVPPNKEAIPKDGFLKIADVFRPTNGTKVFLFYNNIQTYRFLESSGSGHCRGVAFTPVAGR